jgi:hypothetical protein
MILKLLLYPVAYAIYYITTVVFTLFVLGPFCAFLMFILASLTGKWPHGHMNEKEIFIMQVVCSTFQTFCCVLCAVIILRLWGHQYSWIIFMLFILIYDFWSIPRTPPSAIFGNPSQSVKMAGLLGTLIGLALVALLVSRLI